MILMTAPGLPPWPRLFFDPEKRQAIVSVRHPTWRSHEWAIYTTEVIVWISIGLLGWFLWKMIPETEWLPRIMAFLLACGILFPIALFSIRFTMRGFLARQVFATKTVVWFTEEAITFRSRIYPQPIIIWRTWNDKPVKGRFILQEDHHAKGYSHNCNQKRNFPKNHLHEAMILEIVLTTVNQQKTLLANTQNTTQQNILRTLPITELNTHHAPKFSMVYTAATLTNPKQTNTPETTTGTDIDAA